MDEILKEFLKSLKISLNNASVYFNTHPLFVNSIRDLKERLDKLFTFLNSIKIKVGPDYLWIREKKWQDDKLYQELATFFHYRKIKAVEINKGISSEELMNFIINISLPPSELFKKGTIRNILKEGNITHIRLEELDYSQLLKEGEEEAKDMWLYLFKEAIEKKENIQVDSFVKDFEKILGKFKLKDILTDEKLRENFHVFFSYLKEKSKDKFIHYSKKFIKLCLREKALSQEEINKIESFFKGLDDKELADVLWEELTTNKNFDTLSFKLFCTLIEEKRHKNIAYFLTDKIDKQDVRSHDWLKKKIENLFSSGDYSIPVIYRHAFSSLLKTLENYERKDFSLDYTFLKKIIE
jgi:hypothetical protein